MPLCYLEPSALVKRYVREPGSIWLRTMMDQAGPGFRAYPTRPHLPS